MVTWASTAVLPLFGRYNAASCYVSQRQHNNILVCVIVLKWQHGQVLLHHPCVCITSHDLGHLHLAHVLMHAMIMVATSVGTLVHPAVLGNAMHKNWLAV